VIRVLGGVLAALLALIVGGVAVLATRAGDTVLDLDVPEEGDDLLTWAAANPNLTVCPDYPGQEGL
jgi:ABC-type uncharacterized transport system YnjBCD substrate-binding protein